MPEPLNAELHELEHAARLVADEAATLSSAESAKLLGQLDDLCTSLLMRHGLCEDTTTVFYIPSENSFFAFVSG
jgi:hypothetical protein